MVYNYDEEGVILWDFPKNFDWDNLSMAAASVIEKFSDFGTQLRSLKYKGKTCYARGHVVVFANRPPLPELSHRNVVEFHIDSYVPPQIEFKAPAGPIEEPLRLDFTRKGTEKADPAPCADKVGHESDSDASTQLPESSASSQTTCEMLDGVQESSEASNLRVCAATLRPDSGLRGAPGRGQGNAPRKQTRKPK